MQQHLEIQTLNQNITYYTLVILLYFQLNKGALTRRIATYKIGAFLLSSCGFIIAPVVAATATVPMVAIPGYDKRDN
jgi:hypothetical protein